MSRNTSVYLDFLRLIAAFCVFLDHSRAFVVPALPAPLASYGAEAVAVFFVLSGFVIGFVVTEKETDLRSYSVARISRIYPVAIVAIITTTLADHLGNYLNTAQYYLLNQKYHFYRPETFEALFRYLTFTNQTWFSHYVYGADEPYWSLGFEVWYYILFGILAFAPINRRVVIFSLMSLICGIKIMMYFPLWLLGYFTFKSLKIVTMERNFAGVLWATSIFVLTLFVEKSSIRPTDIFHTWTITQELKNLYYFYSIGILVAINIISFNGFTRERDFWRARQVKWVRWAAGASFTLYLVHQPIEVLASAMFPDIGAFPLLGALALMAILALILALAELGERRKHDFKSIVEKMLYRDIRRAVS